MAGRFLTPEEAARHLGVTVDEINRLVDRKKLFPIRDGATVKFKLDDLDRAADDSTDEAVSAGGDLELDLSSSSLGGSPAAGDDLVLGDAVDEMESIFDDEPPATPAPKGAAPVAAESEDEELVIGGSGLAGSDLDFDSLIGGSSPSAAKGSAVAGGSDALDIDLGSAAIAGLSLSKDAGKGGSAILGDSGLSLEGGLDDPGSGLDLGGSGVQLEGPAAVGGPAGDGGGGDPFELGENTSEDESASVVVPTEESLDSSVFGVPFGESSSTAIDVEPAPFTVDPAGIMDPDLGPAFSPLQIVGLVCCSLFLLTCGLVMIDLVWSIRAAAGRPISSPLLQALTELFAWR